MTCSRMCRRCGRLLSADFIIIEIMVRVWCLECDGDYRPSGGQRGEGREWAPPSGDARKAVEL